MVKDTVLEIDDKKKINFRVSAKIDIQFNTVDWKFLPYDIATELPTVCRRYILVIN